jgi:adenylosuccinate lyase
MKKIRLNKLDFFELLEGLKEIRVEIVAFYGEFNKCLELAEKFIEKRATSSVIINKG